MNKLEQYHDTTKCLQLMQVVECVTMEEEVVSGENLVYIDRSVYKINLSSHCL